ncbi:MAG: hypothetical protein ACRDCC_03575 [Culicoidibacterales bacterium]
MEELKFKVEMKRTNETPLNTWEMQDFLGSMINNYYKLELLQEMKKELNSGVELEDIIIMDKSFDFKQQYAYLNEKNYLNLNSLKDVKRFYHLGLPASLLPSRQIFEMNVKMNVFKELYTILNEIKVSRLNKNKLLEIFEKECTEAIGCLSDVAIENIISSQLEKKQQYVEKIKLIMKKYNEKIAEYNASEFDIENTKNNITNDTIFKVDDDMNVSVKSNIRYFQKSLSRLERPIVLVFNRKENTMKIVCSSYLKKSSDNSINLDVKSYTHNSPTTVLLSTGVLFLLIAVPVIKARKVEKLQINSNESLLENYMNNLKQESVQNKLFNNILEEKTNDFIEKSLENLQTYGFKNENLVVSEGE